MQIISQIEPQEFGKELERLSNLSGIPLPPDPKATLQYVRKQYGRYNQDLVTDAIDWYLQGFMDDRARHINAMFVIKIFRSYLKHNATNKTYYARETYVKKEPTAEEVELINKKAMGYVAEEYYNVKYKEATFKLHMKSVESLYDYAMRYAQELDFDSLEYWEKWIKTYLERKHKYAINELKSNHPLRNLGYERNLDVNYYKCAHVLSVIQKRIDDGWTP